MQLTNNREDRAPTLFLLLPNKVYSTQNWLHIIKTFDKRATMGTPKEHRLLP